MRPGLESAERYRERARELRILAADQHANHDSLLIIASTYERLAASLDIIEKTNRTLETTL